MRVALDANILAYAEGVQQVHADLPKIAMSETLLAGLLENLEFTPVAPIQALAELFHLLTRKGRRSREYARSAIERIAESTELAPTTAETFDAAIRLAASHRLQIFDAIILAASAAARCEILLSEDLQDGFRFDGVTVLNPFGPAPGPTLQALLGR